MPVLQSQVCDQLDALNQYERPTTLICAGIIQGGQDACQVLPTIQKSAF